MKKLVFLSALALVSGAVILRLLQHDAGYVLIVAWGKTIEMRVMVALIVFLAIAAVCAFAMLFVGRSLRFVRERIVAMRAARAARKQKRLDQAVLHFIAGDWASSKKLALKASKADKTAYFPLLVAARCANNLGHRSESMGYLERAELVQNGDADLDGEQEAILLLKAELLLEQRNYAPCLLVLNQAKALAPSNPAVMDLLCKVYTSTQDWSAVEGLIPQLEAAKVYTDSQLNELKSTVYFSRLGEFGIQLESADDDKKVELKREAEDYWRALPKPVRLEAKFIERYCQLLLLVDETSKAEALIRATLKSNWSQALVLLYGLLPMEDAQAQLKVAKAWLEPHSDDAALRLTLARLCVRNELWGLAREHFQASIASAPSAVAFAELARLLGNLGEDDDSTAMYKQGLIQTAQGLPHLPALTANKN